MAPALTFAAYVARRPTLALWYPAFWEWILWQRPWYRDGWDGETLSTEQDWQGLELAWMGEIQGRYE